MSFFGYIRGFFKERNTKYAKSNHGIRNKHVKHLVLLEDGQRHYVCNRACAVTKEKVAASDNEVTCSNCKKFL